MHPLSLGEEEEKTKKYDLSCAIIESRDHTFTPRLKRRSIGHILMLNAGILSEKHRGSAINNQLLWSNRLTRSAVNRKVGGSSPPRSEILIL